jgi:hypothetical protein
MVMRKKDREKWMIGNERRWNEQEERRKQAYIPSRTGARWPSVVAS